jgi:hypothetical protein
MHQLTDEQLAIIITWAKKTPEVQAVFLHGRRAKAKPKSDMYLALSLKGTGQGWRLAKFISYRRVWTAELEEALGLVVHLEPAGRGSADAMRDYVEGGVVELWGRA